MLEWKPEYSVGIESVDHEHRALIGLVNRIGFTLALGQVSDKVEAELAELHRAIAAHFALEERFMRTQRYDQLAQHKADHERLLDELREMMDQLPRESFPAERAQALTMAVEAWFAAHFQTHDARLHRHMGGHHA